MDLWGTSNLMSTLEQGCVLESVCAYLNVGNAV